MFDRGRLGIDRPQTTSYFFESSIDANWSSSAMSLADKYPTFINLATVIGLCLVFCLGCVWLHKQTQANDGITPPTPTVAAALDHVFPPSAPGFTARARLVSHHAAEDKETPTSTASPPNLNFSRISTLINIPTDPPEANEDQSDAVDDEEPMACEDACNKCHPCRTYCGQYHYFCLAQETEPEGPPEQANIQVTVDQQQVEEAIQQALAPLKEEIQKELSSNSLSNPDVKKPLVEALTSAFRMDPAVGDLVKEVRQLSEDMKSVMKYTGAGEEQDNALQRLSKGNMSSQLDAIDEKIRQLPTCCAWAARISCDVGPTSLKLRKNLNQYGRSGSVGRKVAKLPREINVLEAQVDMMLSHKCVELATPLPIESKSCDSGSGSQRSNEGSAGQHDSNSDATEGPQPPPEPVPEPFPEPPVESAQQSAPMSVTESKAQSGTQTKTSLAAEPETIIA
jgi:archaellum component FlaC